MIVLLQRALAKLTIHGWTSGLQLKFIKINLRYVIFMFIIFITFSKIFDFPELSCMKEIFRIVRIVRIYSKKCFPLYFLNLGWAKVPKLNTISPKNTINRHIQNTHSEWHIYFVFDKIMNTFYEDNSKIEK